jgi:uncharacterized protein YbjT (DUF2867 family)
MILVTGAGGTVGGEVVKALQSANAPFRAAYFSDQKAKKAREQGIDDVIIDYNRPETLRESFQGIEKLFLVCGVAANQTQLELNAVQAAKEVGVKHITKLSVWKADQEAFSFAKVHRPVEKGIESSGMSWTLLRPNSFMQNIVNYQGNTLKAQSTFYSASGQARISHVDVRDIASIAVKSLTESGHDRKAYTLSGPGALTYDEIAEKLSKVLGRTITHVSLSPSALKGGMLSIGMPEPYADALLDLERYFREGGASDITSDTKNVTGRSPIPFDQFASDYAHLLK